MTKIVQIANFFGPKSGGLKTSMIELAKQYSSRDIKCLQIIPGIDLRVQQIVTPMLLLFQVGRFHLVVDTE